jgi:hypothetical protein
MVAKTGEHYRQYKMHLDEKPSFWLTSYKLADLQYRSGSYDLQTFPSHQNLKPSGISRHAGRYGMRIVANERNLAFTPRADLRKPRWISGYGAQAEDRRAVGSAHETALYARLSLFELGKRDRTACGRGRRCARPLRTFERRSEAGALHLPRLAMRSRPGMSRSASRKDRHEEVAGSHENRHLPPLKAGSLSYFIPIENSVEGPTAASTPRSPYIRSL